MNAAVTLVVAGALAGCGADPVIQSFDEPQRYKDVVELFDQGIARTCSLNGGVCHNSNSYPDLHSVNAVIATANAPCNAGSIDRNEVNDACEPAADHLVMPNFGVNVRVVWADVPPDQIGVPFYALQTVNFYIDPVPDFLPAGGGNVEIHRSTGEVFSISGRGAFLQVSDGRKLTFNLGSVPGGDRNFFDVRVFPPGPNRLWVGDQNHNGVEGATVQSMRLMKPGDAMNSYLIRRLTDPAYGERMPRQCRTWDDRANQAIACWVAGLQTDGSGKVTNALAPIDYDHCPVDVKGMGRCAPAGGVGLTAVEDIFSRSCGGAACHVNEEAPQAGLDLSPGKVRAALVGVSAKGRPELDLVKPGNPGNSYLWCKLIGDCAERDGDRMPDLAPPLPPAELETIRTWIADGAPEAPSS